MPQCIHAVLADCREQEIAMERRAFSDADSRGIQDSNVLFLSVNVLFLGRKYH